MIRIVWTDQAKEEFTAQIRFIAARNGEAAKRLRARTHSAIISLRDAPRRGRPGTIEGTRELVIPDTPYIAVYGIVEDVIEIYHVYHGRQNWQDES